MLLTYSSLSGPSRKLWYNTLMLTCSQSVPTSIPKCLCTTWLHLVDAFAWCKDSETHSNMATISTDLHTEVFDLRYDIPPWKLAAQRWTWQNCQQSTKQLYFPPFHGGELLMHYHVLVFFCCWELLRHFFHIQWDHRMGDTKRNVVSLVWGVWNVRLCVCVCVWGGRAHLLLGLVSYKSFDLRSRLFLGEV